MSKPDYCTLLTSFLLPLRPRLDIERETRFWLKLHIAGSYALLTVAGLKDLSALITIWVSGHMDPAYFHRDDVSGTQRATWKKGWLP